jgi:hypothetical protein
MAKVYFQVNLCALRISIYAIDSRNFPSNFCLSGAVEHHIQFCAFNYIDSDSKFNVRVELAQIFTKVDMHALGSSLV